MSNGYKIKDHLGNTRVVLDENARVLQANNYYPFGMQRPIMGEGTQNYLYNGKELQEGIDWLDYGFRMYDPQIGRWHASDPLMEMGGNFSPYSYAFNNPANFIDPFGLWPWGDPRKGKNTGDGSGDWKPGKYWTSIDWNKVRDNYTYDYSSEGYGSWHSNSWGKFDPWWEFEDDLAMMRGAAESYVSFESRLAGVTADRERQKAILEANNRSYDRALGRYGSAVGRLRSHNSVNGDPVRNSSSAPSRNQIAANSGGESNNSGRRPLYNVDPSKLEIAVGDRSVSINFHNDYTLFMGINAPNQVAKAAFEKYKAQTGTDLDITKASLILEIFGHAALYMLEIQEKHTDIADCGERGRNSSGNKIDGNRIVWDILTISF